MGNKLKLWVRKGLTFLADGHGLAPVAVHAFRCVGSDQLEAVLALEQRPRSVLDPRGYDHAVTRPLR